MYQIAIQNEDGNRLNLTDGNDYAVTASGLSPVNANIVTASVAGMDGTKYVSAKRQSRNIVLMIYPQRNIEENRIQLYRYISTKKWIRVFFENDSRNVYIDGYVESFETDLFDNIQVAQVSIICPIPAFIDVSESQSTISTATSNFYFPFYTQLAENIMPALDDVRCDFVSISKETLLLNTGQLNINKLA